jgi:hypothetical protein
MNKIILLLNLHYYKYIIIIICTFSPLTGSIIWYIWGSLCTMSTYHRVQQQNVKSTSLAKSDENEFILDQRYQANVCPLKTFLMFTYKISSKNNMHMFMVLQLI